MAVGFADQQQLQVLATIPTHPLALATPDTGNIIVTCPEHTLYEAETFTVTVEENFVVPLAGFQLRLAVVKTGSPRAVSITAISVDTQRWEGSQTITGDTEGPGASGSLAYNRKSGDDDQGPAATRLLFTVEMRVASGQTIGDAERREQLKVSNVAGKTSVVPPDG